MNKLTLFYLICFIIIIYSKQLIVPFDCQIRIGTGDINSSSTNISCESDEILVSCGIIGFNKIQGTYIDPSNPNTCIVGTSNTSYSVIAVANCCKFPKGSITEINTIINDNTNDNYNTQVVTKCPDGSILTGCQINYQSGTINNIKGIYPGPKQDINTLPSQIELTNGINTENQCIAESRSLTTNIRGGAQCLRISSNYELGIYFNIYNIIFH